MAVDVLVRGASLVLVDGIQRADLAVEDGKIVEVGPSISLAARETVDATGLCVVPGLMDSHVHFNEPGRTEWEGVATGSRALAAGGGTCFFDMPLNSSPTTTSRDGFLAKLEACRARSLTDFALWGGLVPGNLHEMEPLAELGVIGFKAFLCDSGLPEFPACDDWTLYRGMELAAQLDLIVAVHAENQTMTSSLTEAARRHHRVSATDYTGTRPIVAELEAIQRALLFAAETGARVHIVHASCARAVSLVQACVLATGADATCETCPHYLILNDDDLTRLGGIAKCAPPLRSELERRHLVELVRSGKVDTIGSDHSPSPAERKQAENLLDAWGGISSVQTTLRTLLTLDLDVTHIARLTSHNVANRFRIPGKGKLAVDHDADLAIVDLCPSQPLSAEELCDRHRLNPYIGRNLRGHVCRTMLRGKTIYIDGTFTNSVTGQLVRPREGNPTPTMLQ